MKSQLSEALARRQLSNIKRVGKAPIWRHPRQYEILYSAYIISIVNALRSLTVQALDKVTPILAARDAETHTDAWPDDLNRLLQQLNINFEEATKEKAIQAHLADIGQKTASWNDKQWQETLLKVLGVDVYRPEHFLGSHIKSFVNENADLITKLTQDTYSDVATTLTRGIRAGDRVETIKKSILSETDLGPGVFKKVETRARLIARDQVGKLNGELTKTRQEAIGVEEYIWRTSLDERVRGNPAGEYPNADPSHFDREGKTFRWDDPPEGGHPGEAIQCRCWAEAIFPEEVTEEEPTEEEEEEPIPTEETTQPENIIEVPTVGETEEEVLSEGVYPHIVMSPSLAEVAAEREAINYLDFSKMTNAEMNESALYKELVDKTRGWRDSLADFEHNAVRNYTNNSEPINIIARGKLLEDAPVGEIERARNNVNDLEKALSRASMSHDIVVYRGMGIDHFTLPPKSLVGKIIEQPVFQSTTIRKSLAVGFAESQEDAKRIVMKIKVRKGTKNIGYVSPISSLKVEYEATINKNARIFIKKVEYAGKHHDAEWWNVEGILL